MKNCVIFMDCHGYEIYKYLNNNKFFINNFNVKCISLNEYVVENSKKFRNIELEDTDIILIQNADILILQVIEKNRGFLNNNEVIKFCNSDCKNNWDLPNKIIDINNINETKQIIQNEIDIMNNFKYDKNEMLKWINFNINEFESIDNLSDIKMSDYFKDNFRKFRLFRGHSYPSSFFLY